MYQETRDERIKLMGETYHARFSVRGQRVQTSLHTKNFKVAVQLVEEIQTAILLGEDWKKEKEIFEDVWPDFLDAKATGKLRAIKKVGEKTLKEYIHFGDRWYLPFFGSMRVDKMGDSWSDYMEYVKRESRSKDKTKFLNHWKYMSGFMSWAIAKRYIKHMPEIYNPDGETDDDATPGRNLTDEQLKALRDGGTNPETGEPVAAPGLSLRAAIYVAQFMGMRRFEINQLPKARINMQAGLIQLRKEAKGARPRDVPIHPEVIPFLTEQIAASGSSPYLFPNAWDQKRPMDVAGFSKPWTQLRQDLGIECVFKDFRSSYASRAFTNPKLNPVLVCMALGMSMKVAMKHYIKPDPSQLGSIVSEFALSDGRAK